MPTRRRFLATSSTSAACLLSGAPAAWAQSRGKTAVVVGIALEPPGLDPTAAAASSIAEVTLYNVYETLTRVNSDGSVSPLLAEGWELSPDLKTLTFRLRRGVSFHNGRPFDANAVKFSFERAASDKSTNKDKRTFQNLSVQVVDDYTVVLLNREIDPDLPFLLGQATAVIVEPTSADTNAAQPVGTGPYRLERFNRGASLILAAWDGYRSPAAARIRRATFRFIPDPAAQSAALLAGDVDLFPRLAPRSAEQFKNNPRFEVLVGGSRAKTIVSINHRRKPLDDVRVRRALYAAIDRQEMITGAADGYGVPIGSFYVPGAPGYIDTTGLNPHDLGKAKQLLAEAGVKTPLELTVTLPPTAYARQGGEVLAAQLAKVGVVCKLQNVEWAQWLANTYGGGFNYDLSIISHVEPFDLGNNARPDYYWGYQSREFQALYDRIKTSPTETQRKQLLGQAQQMLARDAVSLYLYQPQWVTVARRGLTGVWKDLPIFVNHLAVLGWT
ncbi:ABC transporter substrate-binding protein [Xylophilus rhododendri]|uniref:ABC transporter substrate-binding protein n=1 Tax=Xylophilus rhododendri TaxID=2697032 RepID=A0A857J9N6_9BURK|nr:ABC transporter substrate-binding protein [Xylophilus rhododendri]QHI99933.1 ABC transporter substrate-binding protein [Xylophilus rhododendri]